MISNMVFQFIFSICHVRSSVENGFRIYCYDIVPNTGQKMASFTGQHNAQKVKFTIKDFFSKCDQIRSFLWIWSHLLKKSLMENFIFCAVASLRAA